MMLYIAYCVSKLPSWIAVTVDLLSVSQRTSNNKDFIVLNQKSEIKVPLLKVIIIRKGYSSSSTEGEIIAFVYNTITSLTNSVSHKSGFLINRG